MILHEAATTFVALIDAAVMWARLIAAALAFVLCVIAYAFGPLVAPSVMQAARRVARPSWRRGRLQACCYTRARIRRPQRRTAPWVHTQPVDHYEEAA